MSSSEHRRAVPRRGVLAGAAAGLGTVAGCAGVLSTAGGSRPVSVLAAGSLQLALGEGLREAVSVPIEVEAHGSVAAARLVAAGRRDPDLVSLADVALFDGPLAPAWHAVFASNALVIAYNPETAGGRRLERAGRGAWYEPVLAGRTRIGRTDPDQDPLGYRTLFALELAGRYYEGAPALRERLPTREQVYPETALLSQFETGAVDAAFVYRNMAVQRGYDFLTLPAQIDLSDPAYAEEWYSTASYTLPDGRRVTGDVIRYATTARRVAPAVRTVLDEHVAGDYLAEYGFVVPAEYPRYEGDVPDAIRG